MSISSADQKESWTDKDSNSLGSAFNIDLPGQIGGYPIFSYNCVGIIYFKTNESTLDENDKYYLSKLVASYAKCYSQEKLISLQFLIYGHADARTAKKGTSNIALAQKRAEITKDYLHAEFKKRKVQFKVTFQTKNQYDLLSRKLGQSKTTEPIMLAEWRNAQILVKKDSEPVCRARCRRQRADTETEIKNELKRYRTTNEKLLKPKTSSWWACHTMSQQPKVTEGNFKQPLVDGQEMMGALYDAISRAEKYVLITGWTIDPTIQLKRLGSKDKPKFDPSSSLILLIRQITSRGVEARFILWDRATFGQKPLMITYKKYLEAYGYGHCKVILYNENKNIGSLHQKSAVIDGKIGFC